MILVTLRSVVVMVVTIMVVMPVVAVAMTVVSVPVALRATSVGVSDFGDVLGPGADVQFFKHLIGAFVAEELSHAAVLITQVTEDDRIRGTGLAAGWNDGSVRDGDGRITVGQLELPAAVATTCFGPSVLGFDALSGDALGAICLLYTSPSPRDGLLSRMPSSA